MKHIQINNLKLVNKKCLEAVETNMAEVLCFTTMKTFLVRP